MIAYLQLCFDVVPVGSIPVPELKISEVAKLVFLAEQISVVVKLVFLAEQISEVVKLLFAAGRLIFDTVRHFCLMQLCSQHCLMMDVVWSQMVKYTHLLSRYLMID